MSSSKLSEGANSRKTSDNKGTLPPFDKLKAMFVDKPISKKKKAYGFEVQAQVSEDEGAFWSRRT